MAEYPLIVREPGSGDYHSLEEFYHRKSLPFRPWGITSSNAALFSLVRGGYGIACCSRITYMRDTDKTGLREVELNEKPITKEGVILLPAHGEMNTKKKRALLGIHSFLSQKKEEGILEVYPLEWDRLNTRN